MHEATMMEKLKSVSSIDEVIAHHDSFLDTCMKECMLHNPQLLKILTKLMSTCIIFANHTERFTKTLTLDLEQPPDENLPDAYSGLKPPEVCCATLHCLGACVGARVGAPAAAAAVASQQSLCC
jgi:hypothetical protein